jgi:hypothetical protein
MHNSQNSVLNQSSFTSVVLAQAKLSCIPITSTESTDAKIQALPTFHTPKFTLPEVTADMRATLSRLSADACQRVLLADTHNTECTENTEDTQYTHTVEEQHQAWQETQSNRAAYFRKHQSGVVVMKSSEKS